MFGRKQKPVLVSSVVLAPLSSEPSPQHREMALEQMRKAAVPAENVRVARTETSGVIAGVDLASSGLKAFFFEAEVSDGNR